MYICKYSFCDAKLLPLIHCHIINFQVLHDERPHTDFVSLSAMSFQVFTLAADPYSTHVLGLRRCGNLNQVWVVVWKETDFKD